VTTNEPGPGGVQPDEEHLATAATPEPVGTGEDDGPDAAAQNHEPNQYGFAGGATAPSPTSDHPSAAEDIAIPADDLTAPFSPGSDPPSLSRRRGDRRDRESQERDSEEGDGQ